VSLFVQHYLQAGIEVHAIATKYTLLLSTAGSLCHIGYLYCNLDTVFLDSGRKHRFQNIGRKMHRKKIIAQTNDRFICFIADTFSWYKITSPDAS